MEIKKLIEVALPLDAINTAASKEKSIRQGHPSTLHLWWARRPLAAARAVLFAQLVNDPSWKWEIENPGKVPPSHLKASWAASRKRLFKILEELVKWENTTKQEVLERAKAEIRRSWKEVCDQNKDHPQAAKLFNPESLPYLHDPFCGGGSIPLEAQRLGMVSYASDLNPVAVLITKSMIEIPPRFNGITPIGPLNRDEAVQLNLQKDWLGTAGLAEDVRRYGMWIREEANKRIGHFYPPIEITAELAENRADLEPLLGEKLTVVAWLWARTVKSPNPAFSHVDIPLVSTFILSNKAGKEAYVQPIIDDKGYRFTVRVGSPPLEAKSGTSSGKRSAFFCLMSKTGVDYNYIRSEGKSGRMGQKLMAIIAEGKHGKVYLNPTAEMEAVAQKPQPMWKPDCEMPKKHRNFQPPGYGIENIGDLFTARQLMALTVFSDLVSEVREKIKKDAVIHGLVDDGKTLDSGGAGATAYSEALTTFLALGIGRSANYWSSFTPWGGDFIVQTFGRQAIPMVWDFAEANPFSSSTGNWTGALTWIEKVITKALLGVGEANVSQADAQTQSISLGKVISTDPPYYDNVCYSDLSDFFYVWLRKVLKPIYSGLFDTIAVPKSEELVANQNRHGSKEAADAFFLRGMTQAMSRLASQAHEAFPVTIYYAFKQSETDSGTGTVSTGWETFLEAIIQAGFAITGTWPMRTERDQGLKTGSNVLASSIILVCRKRPSNAQNISRRQFLRELNSILPEALDEMTKGSGDERSPVAAVDLSQAIIGPGMSIFSKYGSVLEADGSPMTVRTALQLINRFLAEDDFDADTQFCLHWFEQNGWKQGVYGEADVLARAKGTSVDAMKDDGIVESGGGIVRLRKWLEYPNDWNPETDTRNSVWETLHHLIRALKQEGETASGRLLSDLKDKSEAARQLAYRLYTLCERQGWPEDARAYNEVITSWSGIETAASAIAKPAQGELFEQDI